MYRSIVALMLACLVASSASAQAPDAAPGTPVTAQDLLILHDEGWDAEGLAQLVRRADVLDVAIADLTALDRAGVPPLVAETVVRRRLSEIGERHEDYRAWERERRRRGGDAPAAQSGDERRRLSDPGSTLLLVGAGVELFGTDDADASFRLEVSSSLAITVAPSVIVGADLQLVGVEELTACVNAGFIVPLGRLSDVYFLGRARVGGGTIDAFSSGGLAYGFEGGVVFTPGRLSVGAFGSFTWIDVEDDLLDQFGAPVGVVNRSVLRVAFGLSF